MTAYRENTLEVARLLLEHGPQTASSLKKLGSVDKTYSILYKNFYGWFLKGEKRGQYVISPSGEEAVQSFLETNRLK